MTEKIGEFSQNVIEILNLKIPVGTAIYVGETNRIHMKNRHPQDFEKYYSRIGKIIENPDFVGVNPSDNSIEFIKSFGKHIKVAVRIANDNVYYARSLYSITTKRVSNFVKENTLFCIDKQKNI